MTSDAARWSMQAYRTSHGDYGEEMAHDPKGPWVRHEDYAALLAERDEAQDCARESAEAMRRIRDERDALRSERDMLKEDNDMHEHIHGDLERALAAAVRERDEANVQVGIQMANVVIAEEERDEAEAALLFVEHEHGDAPDYCERLTSYHAALERARQRAAGGK